MSFPAHLYSKCCPDAELSEQQSRSLQKICVHPDLVDKSCSREEINTCGESIESLLEKYPIYNPQKGLYKSWGDIEFPWQISNITPGLLISETDDRWGISTYRAIFAYREGDIVLLIENYGYTIGVYQALVNIVAISRRFDKSKWKKLCGVQTTVPVQIPTAQELRERFKPFKLSLFDTEWSTYSEKWSSSTLQQTIESCSEAGLKISDLEKCLKSGSSDQWREARVRKEFFYREGDFFIVEGECGDVLQLFAVEKDVPATEELLQKFSKFSQSEYWSLVYSVETGENKCLGYQKRKTPHEAYEVVEIGSKGHFVEAPIPFSLSPTCAKESTELGEITQPPKILSPREIFDLEHKIYPYSTECDT